MKWNQIREWWWAYTWFILSSLLIIVGVSVSYFYFKGHSFIIGAIGTVAGLLSQIPIKLFLESYGRPILEIDKFITESEDLKVATDFEMNPNSEWLYYKISSVIIKNVGRSAAKNCKGYIKTENNDESVARVCWAISKERPNATINVKDTERLHICAFCVKEKIPETTTNRIKRGEIKENEKPYDIIRPNEDNWPKEGLDAKTFRYNWQKGRNFNANDKSIKILVTAENARSIEISARINTSEMKAVIED